MRKILCFFDKHSFKAARIKLTFHSLKIVKKCEHCDREIERDYGS